MEKKKVLIINKKQFGYHTDYYKYCEHLNGIYDITFLCFDAGLKKLVIDGIKIVYVSNSGIKLLRGIRFIITALICISRFKGIIFIHYFEKCQVLKKILPWKKMILDIRTLSVNTDPLIRESYDRNIRNAIKVFDFVTIISEGLRRKINLDTSRSMVLPLGSDVISNENKTFNEKIKLLYVGRLDGRDIHQTIIGLSLYLRRNPADPQISYDIIGEGVDMAELKSIIVNENLQKIVTIHGQIPHFELQPYFDKCNAGVSYVPMTDYYEYQPVTKTFEYILSGMPCIATNTFENKQVITNINGVLCDDNPDSFADSLEQLIGNRKNYDSDLIRNSLYEFTWDNIVKKILISVFERF